MAQRKGTWRIMLAEFEDEQGFRETVELELARLENMMHRLGDGFMVAPLRLQDRDTGEYFTAGYAFQKAFMPAARHADQPASAGDDGGAEPAELTEDEIEQHFPEPLAEAPAGA